MLRTGCKLHDAVSEAGLVAALLALAAIVLLSFIGTLSRYLMASPIGWVPDWSGYLLAASVFLGAPAVTRRRQHVAMDLLATLLSRRPLCGRLVAVTAALMTCAILFAMSVIVGRSLHDAWQAGTGTAAAYPIPRWWLLAVILYGFASSGLHVLRIGVALALHGDPSDGAGHVVGEL